MTGPMVVPCCFYHGEQHPSVLRQLAGWFDRHQLFEAVVLQNFSLVDIAIFF